jgi:hypothetical protein
VYTGGSTTTYSYTPPDSATAHSFGLLTLASANQGKFRLFQGSFGGAWSNLQTSFD